MSVSPRARRAAAGFTLLELLVGVIISSVIVMLAMMAWRPMSSTTLALRDRARDTTELHLAVETLLQDLGGADTALPSGEEHELQIVREQPVAELAGAWDAGDQGILYTLTNGSLERRDLALGTAVVVASGLRVFDIERVADSETHVTLRVGEGLGERQVELVWPR